MFKQIIVILIVSLLALISAEPTINYIGASDNGVSHFPVFQGLKMHIRCYNNPNTTMSNGPVALFDAGLPFASLIFARVIEELVPELPSMNVSRACFFDRYGYGWSDAAPYPFMSTETVFRLHESLKIANIQAPYIMVGWSWGSVDIQNFALEYMDEVVGMFTIDGTDSAYAFDPVNPARLAGATGALEQCLQLLPSGQLQYLAQAGAITLDFGYIPADKVATYNFPVSAATANNDLFVGDKFLNAAIQEVQIMIPSTSLLNSTYQSINTAHPLSNIPFIVLTADSNGADWINRQSILASLSTRSLHIHDSTSSHFIPLENPAIIVSSFKVLVTYVDQHVPVIVI